MRIIWIVEQYIYHHGQAGQSSGELYAIVVVDVSKVAHAQYTSDK